MDKLKKFWSARRKLEKVAIVSGFVIVLGVILIPVEETPQEIEVPLVAQDVSTIGSLSDALASQLGQETNEGVPRGVEVSILEDVLYVDFALDTDDSKYLILSTAWYAVDEIVQLVQLSGLSDNLVVNGSLELIDKNGNSLGQGFVFTANFLDDQVQLLNTDRLLGKEAWERAATSFQYHSSLLD